MNAWLKVAVGVGIVALGGLILFPVFAQVKQSSGRYSCGSNLNALARAMVIYESDHDDRLCLSGWQESLSPYVKDRGKFRCKSFEFDRLPPARFGFALNYRMMGLKNSSIDPSTLIFFETDALGPNVVANVNARCGRHGGKSFVVQSDGSAKYLTLNVPVRGNP